MCVCEVFLFLISSTFFMPYEIYSFSKIIFIFLFGGLVINSFQSFNFKFQYSTTIFKNSNHLKYFFFSIISFVNQQITRLNSKKLNNRSAKKLVPRRRRQANAATAVPEPRDDTLSQDKSNHNKKKAEKINQ